MTKTKLALSLLTVGAAALVWKKAHRTEANLERRLLNAERRLDMAWDEILNLRENNGRS